MAQNRVGARIMVTLVLDLSSLDLEEIATALADQTDYEHRWLINPQTGEIVFWTAGTGFDGQTPAELDEPDLVAIHPLPSRVWYQDMADFAGALTDERAGRRLARAIEGEGAFRRFKDQLHEEHPGLLPAWYAFLDARATRRAVQWLTDNSLIDDEAADRFLAGSPDPVLP
jgi:(2Fe-2S) ferredoxin